MSTVTWCSSMLSSRRRLGLRARPVDLVGQHDVGEHGAGLELEVVPLLVVDVHAGDVRRQEVRGELDPAERAVDRARDRLRQHRLADAGHVLDQQVPLGDQAHEREPHLAVLALDDPFDVVRRSVRRTDENASQSPVVLLRLHAPSVLAGPDGHSTHVYGRRPFGRFRVVDRPALRSCARVGPWAGDDGRPAYTRHEAVARSLVLNVTEQPLAVVPARRAVVLVLEGEGDRRPRGRRRVPFRAPPDRARPRSSG